MLPWLNATSVRPTTASSCAATLHLSPRLLLRYPAYVHHIEKTIAHQGADIARSSLYHSVVLWKSGNSPCRRREKTILLRLFQREPRGSRRHFVPCAGPGRPNELRYVGASRWACPGQVSKITESRGPRVSPQSIVLEAFRPRRQRETLKISTQRERTSDRD